MPNVATSASCSCADPSVPLPGTVEPIERANVAADACPEGTGGRYRPSDPPATIRIDALRPLIGISTSEVRSPDHAHPVPQGDPRASELALGRAYMQAVEGAG